MDNRRIDQMARSLATGSSRRGVLKGLLAGVAAPVLATVGRSTGGALSAADCAQFCQGLPPGPARGTCVSDAERGTGLCYQCGPASTDPSQQLCGGSCVSTATDTGNCGNCGNSCAAGQTCVAGACITPCPDGQTACNGSCADLQTDPAHCGACETHCAFYHAGAACLAGVCSLGACEAGYGNCDAESANGCETDVTSSLDHCGACGTPCVAPASATASCVGGTCTYACDSGFTDCGGACIDLQTDVNHCGACDKPCPEGASCSAGACACPASAPTVCTYYPDHYNPREHCVDTQGSDNANCGGCNYTCGSVDGVQEICRDGGCRAVAGVTCYAVTGVEEFCYSGRCVNPDGSTCTNPYFGGGCVCA